MLTPEQIVERRTRYACCSFDYMYKAIQADIYGDLVCAAENRALAIEVYRAVTIMNNTDIGSGGCETIAYASFVASQVDCLCECSCGDPAVIPANCTIPVDAVAVVVPCDTLVDSWIFTGAGTTGVNGVYVPVDMIPEAEPDTQVYAFGSYTQYIPVGETDYVVDLVLGTHLYTAPTLSGTWVVDTGVGPAPTQTQATLGDLCETDLTPEEQITLAVPDPDEESIYATSCCGQTELFYFNPTVPEGFDYEFDFGLN